MVNCLFFLKAKLRIHKSRAPTHPHIQNTHTDTHNWNLSPFKTAQEATEEATQELVVLVTAHLSLPCLVDLVVSCVHTTSNQKGMANSLISTEEPDGRKSCSISLGVDLRKRGSHPPTVLMHELVSVYPAVSMSNMNIDYGMHCHVKGSSV